MGAVAAVASTLGDMNPLSVIKSGVHDLSAFVLNSCRSECDCCGCLHWIIQTNETHDDTSDDGASVNITWANK